MKQSGQLFDIPRNPFFLVTRRDSGGYSAAMIPHRKLLLLLLVGFYSSIAECDEGKIVPSAGNAAVEALRSRDFAKARSIAEPLAVKGDVEAQIVMAQLYLHGEGVPKDAKKAADYFRQAALKGDRRAQRSLGVFYQTGQGVPENMSEAIRWYRLAGDAGDITSAKFLGSIYMGASIVSANIPDAIRYFEIAANQGDVEAEFNLATILHNPGRLHNAVELEDLPKAAYWYQRAFEHGDMNAATNLAGLYLLGDSRFPKDLAKAVKLFEAAAMSGDKRAQFNLGILNWSKDSLGVNPILAYSWLSVAQQSGHEQAAGVLKSVEADLSPQDLVLAKTETLKLRSAIDSKMKIAK